MDMNKKIPFLDLRITDERERKKLLKLIEKIFYHGRIVLGPEVEAIEKRIADYCGRKYGIGINSGTNALYLCLRSFGIGHGDEVITTSLSWIATANVIALTGATPVFADIQDNLNIDPDSVKKLITSRTRAILPVHYTGTMCCMPKLIQIAKENDLILIEDAAQAFGATLNDIKAGAFSDAACFSMNPMKVLAACGEAGIVVTDRSDIYKKLISLRYNGTMNKEKCIEPSINGRLDTLQAAILLHRINGIETIINKRRQIASLYNNLLQGIVTTPMENKDGRSVYYTYTIQANNRDELKKYLENNGVETKIQHPILMPDQMPYKSNPRDDLTNARRLIKRILCIPANEKLTLNDIKYIASIIKKFYHG